MGVPVYITIVGANSAADMAKVGGLWYGKFMCAVYAWEWMMNMHVDTPE